MEFDPKLSENMTPQGQQPMVLSENCLKPCMKYDQFPSETTPSSSSSKGYYLQDFHHLDHQIHVNGSSSNPAYVVQTACYDPFDAFPYGYSTNNVDFYECKPFADNVGHGQVMDNFQSGGFLNLSQRNSNNVMGSDIGCFDLQETKPVNFVVPDEVSCVTAENAYYKKAGMNKNRVLASNPSTWKGRKKSNVVKGQWLIEEDRLLIQLVEQYGVRKWSHIAQMLPGRIGKQCRERWHNHLRPDIKKDTWSEEEDKVLIQAHIEIGNKWAEIAKRLPGRTENSIKNHWNATKRRQFSKRKCRSKYPRGSILQEYIKSLNLESSSTRFQEKSSNGIDATVDKSSTKPSNYQPQALDFCPSTDRLVPEYDFNEVPDFSFDEKLLQESCSIDSLLDEIHSATAADVADNQIEKSFEMDVSVDMSPVMGLSVKKELDLVEMISRQANI
ncbi:transcription factor MYB98-like [Durio zibethinus]|uniref:Transcription factor MYB98-like n=1 Tax=Durio zibethinus TaxID=66656 RepID=A0A6P5Y6J7_DURZI|nr:transcription factor MYB98-like [Durio zibethinus]